MLFACSCFLQYVWFCAITNHSEGKFRSVFYLPICSLLSSLVGIIVSVFLKILKYNARQVPQGVPLLKCSSFSYQKITLIHLPVSAVVKKGFPVRIIAVSLFTLLHCYLSLKLPSKSWEATVRKTALF